MYIGCARCWYLYWLWSQHTDACPAVCRRLLSSPTTNLIVNTTSAAQHSSRCFVVCLSVAGCWPCTRVRVRLDYGNATLAGLMACLLNRLQSVLNAVAPSIAGLRRSEHITDALASFHWLRAPERIKFKLAVIVYRALHGTVPRYLSDQLQCVADLPSRRRGRLRSSTSSLLDVRPSRLDTVGDRSFAAAGPRLWNSLPADVQSAPLLTTFRQKLKTHLFRQSYPDIASP